MKTCDMALCARDLGVVEDGGAEAFGKSNLRLVGVFGGVLRLTLRLLCGCLLASPAAAWDRNDVLHAIHQVENPNNSTRIGRFGELGPFQFRPAVWCTHTEKPFELAADYAEARAVAEMHYDWIASGLVRNGYVVTPYRVALAWNAGLQATVNGRTTRGSRRYAQRVANLVEQPGAPSSAEVASR